MISFPEGQDYPVAMVAADINGNIMNLAGATIVRVTVYRRPREASAAVKVYNLSSGVTITNGAAGRFTFTITHGDFYEGEYSFDCWATLADASTATVGRGEIDVTHFDSLEV